MTVTPGLDAGDVTVKTPVNVPVCPPAAGQPNPPPELTTDGIVALARLANDLVVAVPLVQAIPPVPEVPLPIVCGPPMVNVQLRTGALKVMVQPDGTRRETAACGAAAWFHMTCRSSGVAPPAWQVAGTVAVYAVPKAEQLLIDSETGLETVVVVVAGAVPESVESAQENVPPPETVSERFVAVMANAPPG
jgi:hypothetical protein